MAHHPLYPVAQRLVGRHVHVYHRNGQVFPGYLQSVNSRGIYLVHSSYASADDTSISAVTLGEASDADVTPVYSPAGFFAFGALSGLTLGALASRPYGYGYGW